MNLTLGFAFHDKKQCRGVCIFRNNQYDLRQTAKNIEYKIKRKEKRKRKQRKEHVILPCYLEETFKFAPHCGIETRNKFANS